MLNPGRSEILLPGHFDTTEHDLREDETKRSTDSTTIRPASRFGSTASRPASAAQAAVTAGRPCESLNLRPGISFDLRTHQPEDGNFAACVPRIDVRFIFARKFSVRRGFSIASPAQTMMRSKQRQHVLPLLLLSTLAVVALGGPARAQVGGLEVRVLEAQDGGPLPGANVTLANDQGFFATATLQTGPDGRVRFAVLRAVAGYSVEVAMPGFATHRLSGIRVRSNETERIDVMLTQELQERVEVTARQDVVKLDEQAHTSRFDDTFIENLPVPGRFYQNMLTLAPGVNDSDEDGNPNVHGARTREFRALVGGVSNTDPLTGEWLSYINPESIEEMEILTAGAGVQYGRASPRTA